MITIIINLTGIFLIGMIIWWFWIFKPKATRIDNKPVEIIADAGSYTPSVIRARGDRPVKLTFIRKDPNPCAEYVIFDALNINQQLEVNKPVTINLGKLNTGEYEFTCQMGMYRGKLIVD